MNTTTQLSMEQSTAREWWDYDPKTGILTWRKRPGKRMRIGQEAGKLCSSGGGKMYRRVGLNGFHHRAHRIIWVWMTGHFPEGTEQIDHIDGNGLNNRWDNLRLVSGAAEQGKNMRLPKNNKTGTIGVVERSGKYQARVKVNGRIRYLGHFSRIEDAIAARKVASEKYGFHPNHGQERPL